MIKLKILRRIVSLIDYTAKTEYRESNNCALDTDINIQYGDNDDNLNSEKFQRTQIIINEESEFSSEGKKICSRRCAAVFRELRK